MKHKKLSFRSYQLVWCSGSKMAKHRKGCESKDFKWLLGTLCRRRYPIIKWSPPKTELLFTVYIFNIIASLRWQKSAFRAHDMYNPSKLHCLLWVGFREPHPKIKRKQRQHSNANLSVRLHSLMVTPETSRRHKNLL